VIAISVTYLFYNSQFSAVNIITALLRHRVYVIVDGEVIKMEWLNESQLRAQAVRMFEENYSYSVIAKKLGCSKRWVGLASINFWSWSDRLLLLCNHSRSKTRLIAIMNLIAKLGIIYATTSHASLSTTALDCLSVSCHCHRTNTDGTRREGGDYSESGAAADGALGLCKVLCWLPQTTSRNIPKTPLPSSSKRPNDGDCPSILMSHCQHSGLLR